MNGSDGAPGAPGTPGEKGDKGDTGDAGSFDMYVGGTVQILGSEISQLKWPADMTYDWNSSTGMLRMLFTCQLWREWADIFGRDRHRPDRGQNYKFKADGQRVS